MIYLNIPTPVNCRACPCYDGLRQDCKALWRYSGRKTKQIVTYVLGGEFCREGYVVLGLKGVRE